MAEVVNIDEIIGNVWIVYANTDLTEGRGACVPVACCAIEATALRLAKGRDVQGHDATVEEVPLLTVELETKRVHKKRSYGPVYLIQPTVEDRKLQEKITEKREMETKRVKVLERARELGLTDKELELLK
jgi:hypothetical protein